VLGGSSARAMHPPGFSIDRPPARALQPLREFVGCMRSHGVSMPEPAPWRGHVGRLIVYLPPHDAHSRLAYRACDYLRAVAKERGGPH
jgi:hypothetical protein